MKSFIFQALSSDRGMATASVAGISSPLWLPSVDALSKMAAEWLPILGCIWILVQAGFFLYGKLGKGK